MMTSLGFSAGKNERLCDSLDVGILSPPRNFNDSHKSVCDLCVSVRAGLGRHSLIYACMPAPGV